MENIALTEIESLTSLLPYANGPELRMLEQHLSRLSPATFAQLASDGKWRPARHLNYLDREIVRALADAEAGRLDGLVVSMPPQHGKSELCSKGGRGRIVPLWWDAGTLAELTEWKAQRVAVGAGNEDPFVVAPRTDRAFSRYTLRKRFLTACKVLGRERLATLTIHHGRHTFLSHALAGGRTLAEVRDAAGHANVSVTSAYLPAVVDDDPEVGKLFGITSTECRQMGSLKKVRRGRCTGRAITVDGLVIQHPVKTLPLLVRSYSGMTGGHCYHDPTPLN
jgi:integrase